MNYTHTHTVWQMRVNTRWNTHTHIHEKNKKKDKILEKKTEKSEYHEKEENKLSDISFSYARMHA